MLELLSIFVIMLVFPLIGGLASDLPSTADEGRVLVRGKPVLVYPPTAPTRHQLIVGVGVPLQNLPHSVVMGWVLKAQYYLPSLPKDYEPVNLENWNDSRRAFPDRTRRGTVERYEVDNISIRVEPLPISEGRKAQNNPEEDEDDDDGDLDNFLQGLKNVFSGTEQPKGTEEDSPNPRTTTSPSTTPPPPSNNYPPALSRWIFYKSIEQLSEGYGFGGRVCVLRSICEAAEAQFTHTGGVFAELLHIMFSPSTTKEPVSEHRDNEYFRAEQLGRAGAPCADLFRECSTSLLDMFSGVHDLHSDTFPRSATVPPEPILSMR